MALWALVLLLSFTIAQIVLPFDRCTIIETRQNFTESLINVLETGADNLVLADMNEESANYLALQTRQQLAINSLALASQSAQSVLKLF